MITLREYQERAAGDAASKTGVAGAICALKSNPAPDRRIVLEAPTGSGKTVILAAALDRAARDAAVLWLTPGSGGLHEQSFRALSQHLASSPLVVATLTPTWLASNSSIGPGTVLVANWESLTQRESGSSAYKNAITRLGERRNLFDALKATTQAGTPLVLVIDESHYGADAQRINELLSDIQAVAPAMVVETSATPTRPTDSQGRSEGRHVDVLVTRQEVIDAGMIRYRVAVNPGLADRLSAMSPTELDGATGESLCLEAALEKQHELTAAFESRGTTIRPLLLIQVPNGRPGEDKKALAEQFFEAQGITRQNGRLAVYMADDKTGNMEGIASPDSPVDVMIFKVGIALGWDCPRAQLLVAFRETGSDLLKIQTIGRILRTPERKHYEDPPDPLLDSAYVFSNIEDPAGPLFMDPGVDPSVVNVAMARSAAIAPLTLAASYASRAGTYSDIQPGLFRTCLAEAAQVHDLASKLPDEPPIASAGLISDQDVLVAAGDAQDPAAVTTIAVGAAASEMQESLAQVMGDCLGSYRGRARSIPRMCQALYAWAQENMPSWWKGDSAAFIEAVQAVFWAQPERDLLHQVVESAVQSHLQRDVARTRQVEQFTWELPEVFEVAGATHEHTGTPVGYAYADGQGRSWTPRNPSQPERDTQRWLEDQVRAGNVLWWWKNGTNDRSCFSIAYTNADGLPASFYPDYVAELSSGHAGQRRILIAEAKHVADDDPNTPLKAQALADYCAAMGTTEVALIGGIVVPFGKTLGIHQCAQAYTEPTTTSLTTKRSGWAKVDLLF